jgi:hypothetical protein
MDPAVPVPRLVPADQAKVGLVNEGRGLEGLARRLGRHPCGGELAQLVVHEWQQFGGGRGVASGGEELRHVAHAPEGNRGLMPRKEYGP